MSVSTDSWTTPPQFPELQEGELHIWRCELGKCNLDALQSTLSQDENARAERFYFSKDRASFVACRGTLRFLLGKYLDLAPSAMKFQYTSYGKPYLEEGRIKGRTLQFNLSHSNAFSLFGFALEHAIGLDIEFIRPNVAEEEIAERFFSVAETQKLRSLPAEQQPEAFFRCWTRKEAFIKARGDGLSLPLDQFDVTLAPDEAAALLSTRFDPLEVSRWALYHVDVEEGYSGAAAIEGKTHKVRLFSLY